MNEESRPARRLSDNDSDGANLNRRSGRSEGEHEESHRFWAAMMVALDVGTASSVLRGLRVRASNLDGVVLRCALRGDQLPNPEDYIEVTPAMLEAVDEAGPLSFRTKTNGARR